jgi:hypothetical protein
VKETGVDKTLSTEDIAASQIVEAEKKAPKMKGHAIAASEQIQLRAYFIAERRKHSGVEKKQNASDFLKDCQTDCFVISGPRHLSEKQICLSNQLFDRR